MRSCQWDEYGGSSRSSYSGSTTQMFSLPFQVKEAHFKQHPNWKWSSGEVKKHGSEAGKLSREAAERLYGARILIDGQHSLVLFTASIRVISLKWAGCWVRLSFHLASGVVHSQTCHVVNLCDGPVGHIAYNMYLGL